MIYDLGVGGHGHEVQPELEHLFIDKWESESHKCQAEVMSQQTRVPPPHLNKTGNI